MDKELQDKIAEYRREEKSFQRELGDIEQEVLEQSLKGEERSFESLYSKIAKERHQQKLKEAANHVVVWAKSEGPETLSQIPTDILALGTGEILPLSQKTGNSNSTHPYNQSKQPPLTKTNNP